jgi:hypothetical protein
MSVNNLAKALGLGAARLNEIGAAWALRTPIVPLVTSYNKQYPHLSGAFQTIESAGVENPDDVVRFLDAFDELADGECRLKRARLSMPHRRWRFVSFIFHHRHEAEVHVKLLMTVE